METKLIPMICPVCFMEDDFCEHFVGWLKHSKTIIRWDHVPPMSRDDLDTYDQNEHTLVKTPTITRVYLKK